MKQLVKKEKKTSNNIHNKYENEIADIFIW